MKKLLIQIDCKDELPEKNGDYFTDKGLKPFKGTFCWLSEYDKPVFWYKEVDQRTYDINLLDKYSIWLCKNGYIDTDYKDEPPFAIDEFLKTLK